MLKMNARAFYVAATLLEAARTRIQDGDLDKVVSENDRSSMAEDLKTLSKQLEILGTALTQIAVNRLQDALKLERVTYRMVREDYDHVDWRLVDELTLANMFVLRAEQAKYYSANVSEFGKETADKLPAAIPDIEDAGKSLGLNMGTASVFHSMRVMEAALKALAALMGIPYAPSWEAYITQIERCITEKHARKSIKWKRDEPFYREILGNLQTIKIAWRNPTMHIVRRYSPDEAEEIYIAVRAFLRRLAPRLPLPKQPKKKA